MPSCRPTRLHLSIESLLRELSFRTDLRLPNRASGGLLVLRQHVVRADLYGKLALH